MSRNRKLFWLAAVLVVGYVALSSAPSGADLLSRALGRGRQADELAAKSAQAEQAIANSDEFAAELGALRMAVPSEPDLPGLLQAVQRDAAASGLSWVSAAPSTTPADIPGGLVYYLSLNLRGSSRDVPGFLRRLEGMSRLVVIDSVQVQGDAAASVTISVRFFVAATTPPATEDSGATSGDE